MNWSEPQRRAEILRFVAMGLLTNGVYFSVLWLLQAVWSLTLWLSAAISYIASMVFNYLAQKSVTFRNNARHGTVAPRYLGVQLTALTLNSVTLGTLVTGLGLPFLAGQAVALVLTTALSYWAQRTWVFARS